LAMRTSSSRVMEAPGLCSPSRRVVSKMMRFALVAYFASHGVLRAPPMAEFRINAA